MKKSQIFDLCFTEIYTSTRIRLAMELNQMMLAVFFMAKRYGKGRISICPMNWTYLATMYWEMNLDICRGCKSCNYLLKNQGSSQKVLCPTKDLPNFACRICKPCLRYSSWLDVWNFKLVTSNSRGPSAPGFARLPLPMGACMFWWVGQLVGPCQNH